MITVYQKSKEDAQSIQEWAVPKLGFLDLAGFCSNLQSYKRIENILKHPENLTKTEKHEVEKFQKVYSRAFNRFINTTLIKDDVEIVVAKYLIWTYYMHEISRMSVFKFAIEKGLIRKSFDENGRVDFYVVGLKTKVLKNTEINKETGREIKKYDHYEGLVAIKIDFNNDILIKIKKNLKKEITKIKELESHYSIFSTSEINPVRLTEKCKRELSLRFSQ